MNYYEQMAEYHRGYEDGKRAMDAKRCAVVARLRVLGMGDSSHENLSNIAKAIHPADWWTPPACGLLRDKIIELLGGATDGCCCGDAVVDCARGAAADNRDGQHAGAEGVSGEIAAKEDANQPDFDENLQNTAKQTTNALQIADGLRNWAHAHVAHDGELWTLGDPLIGELLAIADRIDEAAVEPDPTDYEVTQYYKQLRRWMGEAKHLRDRLKAHAMTLGEAEAERDVWREAARLHEEVAERNERWCASLLDLIKDAATEYQLLQMNYDVVTRSYRELTSRRTPFDVLRSVEQGILTSSEAMDELHEMGWV